MERSSYTFKLDVNTWIVVTLISHLGIGCIKVCKLHLLSTKTWLPYDMLEGSNLS